MGVFGDSPQPLLGQKETSSITVDKKNDTGAQLN